MLALDGPLRYAPFAAFHDGTGWLVQRYATSLYTTSAPTALTAQPTRPWRVAAFGNAQGGGPNLPPLPAVRRELETIVRDRSRPGTGVLEGRIWLDNAFTAQALRAALKERPAVVHIASHFVYDAGDASASYLLLGDKGELSLSQIDQSDLRFDQVDLVTLSACETARMVGNSFGQEVEALGTLLQARGAAAVLSSLWQVDDDSTAELMRRMYAAREGADPKKGPMSRAHALRDAQLSMLMPAALAVPKDPAARAATERGAGRRDESPVAPPNKWARPFYWAPFVLMGNWL